MRKTSAQPGRNRLHKLCVNTLALPQVVFATHPPFIIHQFMNILYKSNTQLYAQSFSEVYGAGGLFIPLVHTLNNEYYKGD